MDLNEVKQQIRRVDRGIGRFMARSGHRVERLMLGGLFVWFGILKLLGEESATSIIAKTVYWGPPEVTVPALGAWEAAVGVCLWFRVTVRVAIALLFLRLLGTLAAFVLAPTEVLFHHVPWAPTIQGQYLVKDVCLVGAALVVGGTVHARRRKPSRPPVG